MRQRPSAAARTTVITLSHHETQLDTLAKRLDARFFYGTHPLLERARAIGRPEAVRTVAAADTTASPSSFPLPRARVGRAHDRVRRRDRPQGVALAARGGVYDLLTLRFR